MAELLTIQDSIDGRLDTQTLKEAVNEDKLITSRLGKEYASVPMASRLLVENGLLGATPFSTYAAITASTLVDGDYAIVTNDTASKNGVYQKQSGVYTKLAWNNFSALNALNINSGKDYPLKASIRNNINSASYDALNACLLDVTIDNADADYHYRISYYANGDTTYSDGTSWIIEKILKSNFATQDNSVTVLVALTQNQRPIVRNAGIQQIQLITVTGAGFREEIFVTVDSDALPLLGSFLKSNTAAAKGYSHIVDPSRLFTSDNYDKTENPLLKYSGHVYPLIKKTFGTTTSLAEPVWLDSILDAKVINAEEGYLYTLAYYTNGSTVFGADRKERWAIFKRPSDSYDTQTDIVDITLEQPTLPRGGVQTLTLNSFGDERFVFVINTDKFPAYGTPIKSSSASSNGYSWAINPVTYVSKTTKNSAAAPTSDIYINYIAATKRLEYRYTSGGKNMQVVWMPNGANDLPNWRSISTSDDGLPLNESVFTIVQERDTDWLPPLVFYAKTGDSPTDSKNTFTGGNHLVGSERTAINRLHQIFVDGASLNMSQDYEGFVRDVSIVISNDIYASNTVTSKTTAMRQNFNVKLNAENVSVVCDNKALIELYLQIDYGMQMTSIGYDTTQLFVGGSQVARSAFNNELNSGESSAYPDAWAVSLKSDAGTLVSYMDLSYGVNTQNNVLASAPRVKSGGGSNTKFYHSAWYTLGATESEHLHLLANEHYKWRGGYVIQAPLSLASYDTVAKIADESIFIKNGQDYMII